MLSKIINIAKRDDIKKITKLTEKQIQLLFFLLFNPEFEFTYGELKKQLNNDLKISFNDKTLSRSLSKLKERQAIIWIRAEKFQRNESSIIRLDLGSAEKLGLQNQAKEMLQEYNSIKKEAEMMIEKEINTELIEIAKKQVGAMLYLKLLHAQDTFNEEQTALGLIVSQIFYDSIQDLYIEEIKKRGKKSIREVLHHFLNTGTETGKPQYL